MERDLARWELILLLALRELASPCPRWAEIALSHRRVSCFSRGEMDTSPNIIHQHTEPALARGFWARDRLSFSRKEETSIHTDKGLSSCKEEERTKYDANK
jgi:hypothetical protein